MAYIVDTYQNRTITLLVEGYGTIVGFTVSRATAHPGDIVTFAWEIRNDGPVADDICWRLVDNDTGEAISSWSYEALAPGATKFVHTGSIFKMPNKNWNVRLEAGHVE